VEFLSKIEKIKSTKLGTFIDAVNHTKFCVIRQVGSLENYVQLVIGCCVYDKRLYFLDDNGVIFSNV
jgi:hypothetical protein